MNRIKLTISIAVLLLLAISVQAQQVNIIPQPKLVKHPAIAANFSITPSTLIVLEGSNMTKAVNFFNPYFIPDFTDFGFLNNGGRFIFGSPVAPCLHIGHVTFFDFSNH